MIPDKPGTIIAVTSDEQRHRSVVERAATVASESGATVILFDINAGSLGPLESPLPTVLSAEGDQEQFGNRLDPGDLDAAGQGALADRVRVVRAAGIDAFGWLPDKADAQALARYAAEQAADLVLVSADDTDLIEGLRAGESANGSGSEGDGSRGRPQVEAVPAA
jgi:hypothetical protein